MGERQRDQAVTAEAPLRGGRCLTTRSSALAQHEVLELRGRSGTHPSWRCSLPPGACYWEPLKRARAAPPRRLLGWRRSDAVWMVQSCVLEGLACERIFFANGKYLGLGVVILHALLMLGTKAQLPCLPSPAPHSRVGSKGKPCQQSQASHPALQQYLHVLTGVFAPSADDRARHAGLPRVSVAEWEPGLPPPCPAHVRAEHGWGRALEQTWGAQVWLLPPYNHHPGEYGTAPSKCSASHGGMVGLCQAGVCTGCSPAQL